MERLDAIGDPGLRDALLFVRASERPVTADELAAAHGVHRNVARSRLERLVEAGLLEASFERRTGRTGPGAGRPAKAYSVTPELTAIEFPERRYETLLRLLVDALPARGRERCLREVGEQFGRRLGDAAGIRPVGDVARAFDRVCDAVRSLGYQARVEHVTGDAAVIATPTCPLRPLVREVPEAAEIDRGMWAALVELALRDVDAADVQCETQDCLDDHASCRVRLRLRDR
jgi:predicted ArsR family transcriptional regulator